MMFLENKYTKWYYAIIDNASKSVYTYYIEKHHIIPRSLGGTDNKDNIVALTARQHFICHWLLTKMTTGYEQRKMKFALGKFVQDGPNTQRCLTSKQYEVARIAISEARTGYKHTIEARKKMSESGKGRTPWNKGKSVVHSAESNRKRSETLKGIVRSKETIKKMSESKKGHTAGMTGKKHSPETIAKMSKPKQGSKHRRVECYKCKKSSMTPRHIKFCKGLLL